jgi:dipeptidyl aminopeptidase/acylaminoacyl peptidase
MRARTADEAVAKRPMTVEDLWAIERFGAPSPSPDGTWVAVDVASYDMEENARRSSLWLYPTRGAAEPVRLTAHARGRDRSPAWSPDGRRVAFVSERDGDEAPQLYVISTSGGEARRVTSLATGASSPKWFADGRRLAFVSWVWPDLAGAEAQAARVAERRASKVKALAIETSCYRFWDHWLADGRVPHLLVVDVETGECRDLFEGTPLKLSPYAESAELGPSKFDVSPDGAEVAFTADLHEDPGSEFFTDIVVMDLATGAWTNVTPENPAPDEAPRYSPDGRHIAYLRQAIPGFYADRQRVALYDRETKAHTVLTEEWDRSAEEIVWSPDGSRILFHAEDRGRRSLWSLDVAGGEPRLVVRGGTTSGAAIARDGSAVVFLMTSTAEPVGLYALDEGAAEPRRLESRNAAVVGRWALGEVRELEFAGWEDEPVQAWLVLPPDFDPARKWPLLHVIHGGPHGASLDAFHMRWNLHLFASAGYVVVAVNYHGSSGWGHEFADSITGDYGPREFFDLERATDRLLGEPWIDPERLAASGGSYGGYLVAWMNGHTDRYRAYVCHAGVFNWESQMASDVAKGRDRQLGGFPWDEPERVRAASAHAYARSFGTPTLVVHGELDYRVPVSQGFEYYTTLRMRGVPARLLYFPDENHWILKPQNSRLWYREFFAWLERWVGPGPR